VIRAEQDLHARSALFPGILKLARLGYDGKGQVRVDDAHQANVAFAQLAGAPCVLEKFVALEREISVVVARGFDGQCVTFPISENRHQYGILDVSIVPAPVSQHTSRAARQAAILVAEKLDYHGVLCVEFFVLQDGSLLANEIAPRPHNSGHYSIDACITSQFEQQVRVLCGMPLGATDLLCPAVMVNLLGDVWNAGDPDWHNVLQHPAVKLHLYGKAEARPGRKMGHFTVLNESVDAALTRAMSIKADLLRDRVHTSAAMSASHG
jgi:5-(carboxyamino)imidazole ribonucleotide synthase